MATVNPHITDPELRAMLGLPPIGSDPLEAFLEQALDPVARQNIDLTQYLQGVETDPHGITNSNAIGTNIGAANNVLSRLYADNPSAFRGGSFTPWVSFDDWNARQNTRDGFNLGSGLDSFIQDTWDSGHLPMFLAAAGGTAALAPGSAGSAVAGGTAGADITAGAAGGELGGGYFGGISQSGLGLNPAAAGASGLSSGAASGALAPGFFAGESLYPVVGGATGGALVGGLGGAGSAAAGSGAASGAAASLLPSLKDVWGGIKGMLPSGDKAAALAPIIAAIAYAQNQGPFDTSRLTSTYDQFEPEALAFEYDQNTNAGRNALTSSLNNRGVMGSSFGNMDLTNFQTTRDLGRRSLVNQGLAARGGIANNILEAQAKERQLKNQLYGTSLLALGNVFGGRNNQGAP